MKKFIYTLMLIVAIFICEITVSAGDIPEAILHDDSALLFFGEVLSYDKTYNNITVLPTQNIKGDVNIDMEQTYDNGILQGIEDYDLSNGEIYLMAYINNDNPLYVFRITNTDTKTLKIEGIAGLNMWERMQEYLNDGMYEQKETERLLRTKGLNSTSESISESTLTPAPITTDTSTTDINEKDVTNYWLYGSGVLAIVVVASVLIYWRWQKARK